MNKRSLLTLCAGLSLAMGIVLWMMSKSSMNTPEQLQIMRNSEHAAQLVPESSLAQADSNERNQAQSQNTQSSGTEFNDTDTDGSRGDQLVSPAANNSKSVEGVTSANSRSQNDAVALVLSEQVFAVIEDVQQKQMDGKWEESLVELNTLYEEFDELNSFEQTTLLNFYTNTLVRFEMWPEAIGAFSRMLTIPDLRPDIGARALLALGQLHAQEGEYAASITYLTSWQELTAGMENMERNNERVAQLLAQSRLAAQQSLLEGQ